MFLVETSKRLTVSTQNGSFSAKDSASNAILGLDIKERRLNRLSKFPTVEREKCNYIDPMKHVPASTQQSIKCTQVSKKLKIDT